MAFEYVAVICAVTIAAVYFLMQFVSQQKRTYAYRLPPRPPGWPILGNVPLLAGKNRHPAILATGKNYGGIFLMKVGVQESIWITSYAYFREAVVKNAWEFMGRPHELNLSRDPRDFAGIVAGGVDEEARNIRRFTLISLRSIGFGKTSMQTAILQEAESLVEEFAKINGKPFQPRNILSNAAANVIGAILLGRTFQQGDEDFRFISETLTEGIKSIIDAQMDTVFPILRIFPRKCRKIFIDSFVYGRKYLDKLVEDHVVTQTAGIPRDFIDIWLDQSNKDEKSAVEFARDRLAPVLLDLFAGGFETTTTTFQWLFALLLHNPHAVTKIHEELDRVVGRGNRWVSLEQRDSLAYTEAVIMETLRLFPLIPFAVPHAATEDATIGNYKIPKGMRVIFHLYSIHHDPDLWEDAEIFKPERFIKEGKLELPEFFVPFSAGRRSCIGEQLARKELFLFFANIMQNFSIIAPDDVELPSLEIMQGIVVYPPPFEIRAIARL